MDKNAFTELFTIYAETTQPERSGIGAHPRDAVAAENTNNPLVIVTGSQLIAFVKPGDAPCVHDFRCSGGLATLINEGRRSCSTLEAAALAKAFRGELVPQDPNDEPAPVFLERIRSESGVQTKTRGRRARSKTA